MTRLLASLALVAALAAPRPALAWDWLRSENDHVADGNELMASGDPTAALAEYDLAARELPSEPGVHLDRGLALLAMGEYGRAREALQLAAEPPASAEIRAMAHYDIGLSYYLEGDAASGAGAAAPAPSGPAGPLGALGGILGGGAPAPTVAPASEPDHERARGLFREAADAFRDSLRQVPGNRDAGWNLELALRRITEEEEAQREEEEREEENSESDESEESSEDGSEGEEGEESEDGSEGEDSSEGEGGEENEPGEPGEEESEGGDGEEESDAPSEEGDGADESEERGAEEEGDSSSTGGGDEAPSEPDEGEGSETEAGGTTEDSLPPDMERVLDALETGEENLSAARARARGSAERRRVERDW